MRLRKTYISLLICFIPFGGFAIPMMTGVLPGIPILSLPDSYNESYTLLTDRNIYAVGENIFFTAYNISAESIRNACWSRVIYVHLLKPDGTSVAQGKFPLECHSTSAFLEIPDDILTGHYYLCAYTKWMRNFSPSLFSFASLKIINPFSPQLDQSSLPAEAQAGLPDTLSPEKISESQDVLSQKLDCSTDKAIYWPGEKVQISIHYPGTWRAPSGHICLSVVRPGALDTLILREIHPAVDSSWEKPETGYLPEIRGLSISGKILAGDPPAPLENALVEMSILGNQSRLRAYKTNPDGSFYYSLDSFTGNKDMFIAARHADYPDPELFIDNDFASLRISFQPRPFNLTETERNAASEIILNMQLEKLYRSRGTPSEPVDSSDADISSVHGIKVRKLWIDDYIELPNLKEVLIELVPEVMPKTRNRKSYLSFTGNEMIREIISRFDPLILIDQVPVYDLDKLLALSPDKIRSIEVINELYVIGNVSYGGFINIISKNKDMGGIDLPMNSLFFKYEGFQNQFTLEIPTRDESTGNSGPDVRNCLFWQPDLTIEPEHTKKLDFRATDLPGRYVILVRGVAADGSLFFGKCSFLIQF